MNKKITWYNDYDYNDWIESWKEAENKNKKEHFEYDLQNTHDIEKAKRLSDTLVDAKRHRYYWKCKSAKEFVDLMRDIPREDRQFNSSRDGGFHFCLSKSWEESLDRFYNPMNYYKKEVDALAKRVEINVKDSRMTPQDEMDYEVEGDYLDISRHLDGLPDAFVKGNYQALKPQKFVKILVGHNHGPASMDAKTIVEYAANVCSLTNQLLLQGVSVAIDYVDIGECSGVLFPIKGYSESVSLYQLYAILHPSFYRRIIFAAIENSPSYTEGYGYGMCNLNITEFNKKNQEEAVLFYVDDTYQEMQEKVSKFLKLPE